MRVRWAQFAEQGGSHRGSPVMRGGALRAGACDVADVPVACVKKPEDVLLWFSSRAMTVWGPNHGKDNSAELFAGCFFSHILSFARRQPNKRESPKCSVGF